MGMKQAFKEGRGMKAWKRILTVLLVIAGVLTAIFLAGVLQWYKERYT